KAALIAWCKRRKIQIITTGGAGGQIDPTLIQVCDLNQRRINLPACTAGSDDLNLAPLAPSDERGLGVDRVN
ncbi:hypothetical protein QCD79_34325, partial [Pseudomonas quasicaspiana]|nr:hypothetical protein [Pseudomonas quasicaspiana]